jgi:hypothetical protein
MSIDGGTRKSAAACCLAALVAASALSACAAPRGPGSSAGTDRPISATSSIDGVHRLSLNVRLWAGGNAAPGMTPLQILVRDSRGALVRDAVVYVQIGSATGATPRMTLVAANDGGAYHVALPLVHGSRWTFTVKAFSSGRNGVLRVDEDVN